MSKNLWRMPKGYKEMDAEQLADAIMKNKRNREQITQALTENKRGGEVYAEHATVKEQLADKIRSVRSFKEKHGQKSDNLSVVKSIQKSRDFISRGQQGGENIASAYQRHYEAEWAAERGYTYNPVTGRTRDEHGKFVGNRGWSEIVEKTGFNTETMQYDKEKEQYRFKGKGGKSYYVNTTKTAHYLNEGYKISTEFGNLVSEGRYNQRKKPKMVKIRK